MSGHPVQKLPRGGNQRRADSRIPDSLIGVMLMLDGFQGVQVARWLGVSHTLVNYFWMRGRPAAEVYAILTAIRDGVRA